MTLAGPIQSALPQAACSNRATPPNRTRRRESAAGRLNTPYRASCGATAFLELLADAADAGVIAPDLLRLAREGPQSLTCRGKSAPLVGFERTSVSNNEPPFSAFRPAKPGKFVMSDLLAVSAVRRDKFDRADVVLGPAFFGPKDLKPKPRRLRRPGACRARVEVSARLRRGCPGDVVDVASHVRYISGSHERFSRRRIGAPCDVRAAAPVETCL
jgi:hypothetical protein